MTLSPLHHQFQHRVEIEAVMRGASRDAAFDTLCTSIGAAITTDSTLGELSDCVEPEAARPVGLAVDGAASLKAAIIPVIVHYPKVDPLA